jgi:hypothetical protein
LEGSISNFKLVALLPAAGTGAISGAGLSFRALSNETPNETSMGLLPDWRAIGAVIKLVPGPAPTFFRAGLPARMSFEDMLLRNAEVQYVCSKCRPAIAR